MRAIACLMLTLALTPALAPVAQAQPAARLPPPALDEDAPPAAFLRAARQALSAGRGGVAMEALERAESRLLIRSVRPSRAGDPSAQPVVALVSQARAALQAGDVPGALRGIDAALAHAGIDRPQD